MSDDLVKRLREPYTQRQSRRVDAEFAAADRIEELEKWKRYWQGEIDVILAGRADAYDRIEELEAQRKTTYEALLKVTRLHDEVEAKLAKQEALMAAGFAEYERRLTKAVEALEAIVVDDTWGLDHDVYMMCRTTLAELTGDQP